MEGNKLTAQYICAYHEITESEMDFERSNIRFFTPQANVDFSLKSIHYPIFRYDRSKVLGGNNGTGKLPYGECFTSAFNYDASLLACGYSNGHVNVFYLNSKKEPIKFKASDYPITSLKFNDKKGGILLIGSADGVVAHWHINSGKNLFSIKEEDNSVNTLDYAFDFNHFITAGKDVTVRLYDENTKSLVTTMQPYKFDQPGHSSRIFCVKYYPNDTSTIYSGGWDRTIQFYDVRMGKVSNSIYGPEICGDSLDLSGNVLASGAWSTGDQIQLWDIRNLKCICNVSWEEKKTNLPTYIYSVKFNKRRDQKYLCIGGVNKPLFRVFDMNNFKADVGLKENNQPEPAFGSGESYSACFTVDFARIGNNKDLLCCGCSDGGCRVYSIENGVITKRKNMGDSKVSVENQGIEGSAASEGEKKKDTGDKNNFEDETNEDDITN